ncbi:hypothetical protein MWN34_15525 [Ancylobacter sp. 6x-1]|uniref:Uncharacterized protein n=1 Tax=Ancylobacter crimeensis TaxID=2579147 RepID=A0ABT0DEE8_9HYPH|nr:hypothetical protein [Ancylobacter crimeensis]MCK0198322.1 hypothetical protein [Ancylobacter crimeensis]
MPDIKSLSVERHRVLAHIALLEKDGDQPLDFTLAGKPGSPTLIVRRGQALRSAHSEAALDYDALRAAMLAVLKEKLGWLDEKLKGTPEANLTLKELEYGDQTEA